MSVVVVILAGGQGTRFWPVSRFDLPKQFLDLDGSDRSMIRATVDRIKPLTETAPYVITGTAYLELVNEHVPDAKIICEPLARNTAAAIGLAALKVSHDNPDAIMVVLPSDHTVKNEQILLSVLKEACEVAKQDHLVTIGIQPTSPHTGYGYIQVGSLISNRAHLVKRFFEKPNYERAVKYVEDGGFFWNSGMFVWKASVILEEIAKYMPALHQGLLEIKKYIGSDNESEITKNVFEKLENESIDFGVLEHSRNCAVVAAEPFGWSDVGSWDAWAALFPKDLSSNFINGNGVMLESFNCISSSDQRFIALLGCNDLAVIDAGDVVFVCHKDKLQDIKKVITWLKDNNMTELV